MKKLLGKNKASWEENGGIFTAEEIAQQPEMWRLSYQKVKDLEAELLAYYEELMNKEKLNIIFAGAGTSGFVGDSLTPYLKKEYPQFEISSVHTTDLVSHPEIYFNKEMPTLLISFARSGNSPESTATVELAEKMVSELYQLVITCNKDGKLAQKATDSNNKLILLPEKTNDRGFAMTSSFTSMFLAALLFFRIKDLDQLKAAVDLKAEAAEKIITKLSADNPLLTTDFKKIVYLGDYGFYGLAKEASLKLLELTAGQIVTRYDSPLGFRHGPKSIVDQDTLIVIFLSEAEYVLKYEKDLLTELDAGDLGYQTAVISAEKRADFEAKSDFYLCSDLDKNKEDEIFNALEYIVYAQVISLYKSVQAGIKPDNPSPDGSVNRVVQGVKIYPYENN